MNIMQFQIYWLLVAGFTCCSALYEDQIGKFDWHRQNIGALKNAELSLSRLEDRLIVSTKANVLASLSPTTGEIVWRQILEKGSRGEIKLLNIARPNEERAETTIAANSDHTFEILTVQGDAPALVRGWNANIGVIEFEWSLMPLQIERARDAIWFFKYSTLYHVLPVWGSHLEITNYIATSGQSPGKTGKVSASWLTRENCIQNNEYFVCVNGKQLVTLDLTASNPEVITTSLSDDFGSTIKLNKGLGDIVVINNKLASVKSGDQICKHLTTGTYALGYFNKQRIIVHAEVTGDLLEISGYDINGCVPLSQFNINVEYPKHYGTPSLNAFECSGKSSSSCHLIFSTSADAIIHVHKDKITWVREEALANIVAAQFVDLPLADSEGTLESEIKDKAEDIIGAFIRRISAQANQLRGVFLHLLGLGAPPSETQKAGLIRDAFGLHQMLVVLTKCGKMFGVDNASGKHHWQYFLPNITGFNNMTDMRLVVQRTPKHFPLQPLCAIVAKNSSTGNGVIYRFNPITGGESEGGLLKLDFRIKQMALLAETETDFTKGLLIIDETNNARVYPNYATEKADHLFIYIVDIKTSEIKGFQIRYENGKLSTLPLWNIRLGGHEGEHKIVAVAEKNPLEKVHSQGRGLADRSVLYKYVNPNLVAVLTHCKEGMHKGTLNMYLIDAVSGAVVYSMTHRKVSLPVNIVHSENWLAYSYFNDKARRTEITSVELYEGKTQANSSVWSSLAATPTPLVERQSYILPTIVEAMRETITERGITNKHILIGVMNGAIVEVPWAYLDPRRPLIPTAESREEGVLPYVPEIPLHSESTINYYQDVARLSKIYTAPSGLESTCLVLAVGLDIFVTRVSPSKTFDLLKEDFDYLTISAVLIVLTTGSIVAKSLSSRKILSQAWK